jgi:GAF domain-containing protein/HAMP domain-containing protein
MRGGTAIAADVAPLGRPRTRGRLFLKYVGLFVGVVSIALVSNGLFEVWFSYQEHKAALVRIQREQAEAGAAKLSQFFREIEGQLGWTTQLPWSASTLEQRRFDALRLLRQVPAITELSQLDASGKEQLRVSRLAMDVIGSGTDYLNDPKRTEALARKVYYGPVYFRRESEPYMTLAVAGTRRDAGVSVAEVNLKLIAEEVANIKVGERGHAYVVAQGRLIAHPDISLVLRNTDMRRLPQVQAALEGRAAEQDQIREAQDTQGRRVLTAYAKVPRLDWFVFVELPEEEAYAPLYASVQRSAVLLFGALALAALAGLFLARRMVVPIQALREGAERVGSGDLGQRISVNTGDELEALANQFNDMAGKLQESYADLEKKVEVRTEQLTTALQQQTATAEVLKVISRSTFNLQPVLDAIVDTAARLCGADNAFVFQRDGDICRLAASHGFSPEYRQWMQEHPIPLGRGSLVGRTMVEAKTVHMPDCLADPEYVWRESQQRGGFRTMLGVPLLREGMPIGVLALCRNEVAPFTESEIELVTTFADQAVIAIENVRLFDEVQERTRELSESLQQQTATADVLKVISRSAFDLQAVLDTLIRSATQLCNAEMGLIFLMKEGVLVPQAEHGTPPGYLEFMAANPITPGRETFSGRAALTRAVVNVADAHEDPEYTFAEARDRAGYRAMLAVPLMRQGEAIGVLAMPRRTPGRFTDRQIELVQTFADQAVIAIENARLFEEVQARTSELQESLEYQTATSDVLKVISRSPKDLQPVLDAIVGTAHDLCEAQYGMFWKLEADGRYHVVACKNADAVPSIDWLRAKPISKGDGTATGLAALEQRTIHFADALADPRFTDYERLKKSNARTQLAVPLVRAGEVIGVIFLARTEVSAFAERQIDLVTTFADQAVIAINNVSLFEEVQARTRELSESLQQQTATADVLKVISRSAFDLQTVLDTLVESASRLCGAEKGVIFQRDAEDAYRIVSVSGFSQELVEYSRENPLRPGLDSTTGRVALEGRTVHTHDVLADPGYKASGYQKIGGYRTSLGVPLLREGTTIGVFVLTRPVVQPFTDKQIELVTTFADQAVIAIENARLFEEVQDRTRELSESLEDLRRAQDRLIQSEKLASLGQLTAGIAHEIKNPLNFVNNFADVSAELIDELAAALGPASLDEGLRAEVEDLTGMIKGNLEKVVQHGRRADSIVKNMLLHSREGTGERRSVDLNATAEESLNLAYHGARAEKPNFNVTLKTELDPAVGSVEIYPQEFVRVLLNLISNGFYAAHKRKNQDGTDASFEPTLSLTTKGYPDRVEIRVRDNGTGIPEEIKEKMFNPFFTTKPAGEGTGLGLSLSYDIIVKQHGGTIEVDTKPGEFTEFTIALPRPVGPATADLRRAS